MRKLIISLVLLTLCLGLSAQAFVRTASQVRVDTGDGWREWQQCDIKINFDFDNHIIDILTEEEQLLNIEDYFKPVKERGYTIQKMYANDSRYLHLSLILIYYPNKDMGLRLMYSDLCIEYLFKTYKAN